jgi:hypothetical protein
MNLSDFDDYTTLRGHLGTRNATYGTMLPNGHLRDNVFASVSIAAFGRLRNSETLEKGQRRSEGISMERLSRH